VCCNTALGNPYTKRNDNLDKIHVTTRLTLNLNNLANISCEIVQKNYTPSLKCRRSCSYHPIENDSYQIIRREKMCGGKVLEKERLSDHVTER